MLRMWFLVSGVAMFVFSFFFFKQKTAYELRISDWSSDVCSSDLRQEVVADHREAFENLRRNGARLKIKLGHDPPHGVDRRLSGEGGEVGPDEAMGDRKSVV